MNKTWANLLGAWVDDAPWEARGPHLRSICHGPLAALPALPLIMAGASAAMTIIGGVASASAQEQQGAAAAEQGQLRQQQMTQQAQIAQMQADQLRTNANNEMGAAERQNIESQRKGNALAARATAVMAASGGGVDQNLVASLVGEGRYNGNVAMYQGTEKARVDTNQATLKDWEASSDQWGGNAAAQQGAFADESAGAGAAATIIGSVAKSGLSIASMYGAPGGTTPQSGGFTAASAADTMKAYNSMPLSFTRPGMDGIA